MFFAKLLIRKGIDTMTQQTCNGWTNYETWNVKLWLDNDQCSYAYWQETANDVWDASEPRSCFSRSDAARYDLADQVKESIEEHNPLADDDSMYSDLLGAALSDVNWDEIANSLLEECEGYEND